MERCTWYISTDKTGGRALLNSLTNVTSGSHFRRENNPKKTPKNLINVELEYHFDAYDIERLVEATRILMEAIGDDFDSEGDTEN
jgi:hypothetical protein